MIEIISNAVDTAKIQQARRMKMGKIPKKRSIHSKHSKSNILKKVGALS